MKKLILGALCLLCSQFLFSQIGIIGAYKTFKPDNWIANIYKSNDVKTNGLKGYSIGVDYWFRLKNKRIEFTPELSYDKFEKDFENILVKHQAFNFHFNTNFYLFDLAGDCDCPVWSKDGNFFSKGFFVQLSPGVSYFFNNMEDNNGGLIDFIPGKSLGFVGGAGVGLDIGVAKFVTLTPIAKFYYYPKVSWNDSLSPADGSYETKIKEFYLGLKLGVRL